MEQTPATPQADAGKVFPRLLMMLRPYWGLIGVGLVLLLLSMPAELFPGFVWMYVADFLVRRQPTGISQALNVLFSFNGRLVTWQSLLLSSVGWLCGIYVIGETLSTVSNNIFNRVAQKFILGFRNRVYRKLQSQSLAYLQRQRTGDLMSRAMGDVDELQTFIVSGIDVIIGEGVMWMVTVAIVFALDWKVA